MSKSARDVATRIFDALPVTATSCHVLSLAFQDAAQLCTDIDHHQRVLRALAELCSAVADGRVIERMRDFDTDPEIVSVKIDTER